VWLPNLQCIEESIESFRPHLEPYFTIRKEKNAMLNPLYAATENAEEDLLLCPDLITNKTQVLPILQHAKSDPLFYVLELRAEFLPDRTVSAGRGSGKRKATVEASSPTVAPRKRKPAPLE
jgi:hypothetical protein